MRQAVTRCNLPYRMCTGKFSAAHSDPISRPLASGQSSFYVSDVPDVGLIQKIQKSLVSGGRDQKSRKQMTARCRSCWQMIPCKTYRRRRRCS